MESLAYSSVPSLLAQEGGGFFSNFFEVFMPRRLCMRQEADVVWLHVISDALIAVAYYSIPIALVYFVRRRRDLEFNWMFLMFAAFILACGTTHIFGVWDMWQPVYRLDGVVKLATAIVSILTAILLWRLIPKALLLPSPAQLRLANEELAKQVRVREAAEAELQLSRNDLARRVEARTSELAEINRALEMEIHERRRAEEERQQLLASEQFARGEAERANRMKDEFLATLSHELRTPLNAILGWAQVLRKAGGTDEEQRRGLETIERNARAQTKIIDDLLDMSRIIAGKVRLDVQSVDLIPVIEAAIDSVAPAIEAKGLRLQKVLDSGVGAISGDPNRLQQIVWNLLTNAIKFTPARGQIQVTLERVNSHLELSVADTGQGIKTEFLPYVFDRFRQQDPSPARPQGGLGLGLSIVRHLVELHGGTVRVKSPGDGLGATFIVTLPLSPVRRDGAAEGFFHPVAGMSRPIQLHGDSLKGIRILVVDDEADARELIKRLLEQHGAEVLLAESGPVALGILDQVVPHLVISDLGMPNQDGFAFMRAVRGRPRERGGQVPSISLTAFARLEDRVRTLQAGYQMHVAKPVDAVELIAVATSLVGRRVMEE
ncbi:MAG TPA: ATP-binding protein [Phycisphaerae bacterium]|nr:ATP-binding protein [Phycisphaerae bacterium]